MKLSTVLVLGIVLSMSGCAAYRPGPVIDTRGVDEAAMEVDLQQCQSYAAQQPDASSAAAAGAVVGGVFGAAVGAIFCGRNCARKGAALGALGTGTSAAGHRANTQAQIVKNCMAGRGYRVLN